MFQSLGQRPEGSSCRGRGLVEIRCKAEDKCLSKRYHKLLGYPGTAMCWTALYRHCMGILPDIQTEVR